MTSHVLQRHRLLAGATVAALLVGGGYGVASAAGAGSAPTAVTVCVTDKDVVVSAAQDGKCPQGTSKLKVGVTGPQGPRGAAGPAGPRGAAGAAGVPGPAGPAGQDGAAGPQGTAGAQGPAGQIGATGPAGPIGQTGQTGPAGPIGQTGPQGPAGPTGTTAFGHDTGGAAAGDGTDCTLGTVTLTASSSVGEGTPAEGQLLLIQQNAALFALLGTTYGGNGTTNFALPDMRAVAPDNMTWSICDRGVFPSRR